MLAIIRLPVERRQAPDVLHAATLALPTAQSEPGVDAMAINGLVGTVGCVPDVLFSVIVRPVFRGNRDVGLGQAAANRRRVIRQSMAT